jgi:homoserine O-acetyltransferase
VTYRSELELDARFGRQAQGGEQPLGGGGRYAVESYLDHQADKLATRFDANSYVVLTESMNSHDVGRGRGGVQAALARVTADLVVVAVDSDRLYPPRLSHELSQARASSGPAHVIASDHGHDGFLIEIGQVGEIVRKTMSTATGPGSTA